MSQPPPDPIHILRGVGCPVTTLEFFKLNDNTLRLLSGDQKGTVSIWNLSTKRTEHTLNGHSDKSILNALYLKEHTILSHGRDGYIHIWNVEKNEVAKSVKVAGVGFCKCEILSNLQNDDDICLAVASDEQMLIEIVSLKSMKTIKKLKPECSEKLAGYESGDILLWSLETTKMICKLRVHKEPVMCIDYCSTTNRGVTGSAEDKFTVFRLTAEKTLELEKSVHIKNSGISDIRIRADSKIVATAGWDHKLRIFSWKSLKPLAILNYHSQSVDALAFSNCEQQLLAAGSKDGRISLWSLYK